MDTITLRTATSSLASCRHNSFSSSFSSHTSFTQISSLISTFLYKYNEAQHIPLFMGCQSLAYSDKFTWYGLAQRKCLTHLMHLLTCTSHHIRDWNTSDALRTLLYREGIRSVVRAAQKQALRVCVRARTWSFCLGKTRILEMDGGEGSTTM